MNWKLGIGIVLAILSIVGIIIGIAEKDKYIWLPSAFGLFIGLLFIFNS